MKKSTQLEVSIKSLNERGYGVSQIEINDTTYNVYVLGVLPNEKVIVETFKKKHGEIFAHVIEVIEPSQFRIKAKEADHYFACSPWQILDDNYELEVKKELIKSVFKQKANFSLTEFEIIQSPISWNYRNKVEFGFYEDWDSQKISLSFFKREGNKGKYEIEGCELLPDEINFIAKKIVKIINKNHISAKILKHLLIRYSFSEKNLLVNLYVKDKNEIFNSNFDFQSIFSEIVNNQMVKSFSVIYSNPLSPASVNSGILFTSGENKIYETIKGIKLGYESENFFQINPPSFEILIEKLQNWLSNHDFKTHTLLDLYSGVGTIGLCLSEFFSSVVGVEVSANSKRLSEENAKLNNINNVSFIETQSENALDYITKDKVILVDPPRIGLHERVIEKILSVKPNILIYVSCNPETQARDFNKLKTSYNIIYHKAFNFYPQTPHVENLLILELS
jgi:23S rRNA (uracil1939-C5)-methyltransferase